MLVLAILSIFHEYFLQSTLKTEREIFKLKQNIVKVLFERRISLHYAVYLVYLR